MSKETYLAVDLGASSGRVVAGSYDGNRLALETIRRFSTLPIDMEGSLRIDLEAFLGEILQGVAEAVATHDPVVSLGIASWGGQTVAIDKAGALLELPYYYRDPHFRDLGKEMLGRMSTKELYQITGMHESSIPHLLAHVLGRSPDLGKADRVLFLPDFFNYRLCGVRANEYTQARVSQMLDAQTGSWSQEILDKMSIPRRLFGDVVRSPAALGEISQQMLPANSGPIRVIAVGTHDTASALAAAPLRDEKAAFISLGTWAILGCELAKPLITDATYGFGMQNNGIMGGTVGLARNVVGLWLLEECRRNWQSQGGDYAYADMVDLARSADPFTSVINTDSPMFFAAGDMAARVRQACRDSGQAEPLDDGQLIRTILEGLALSYRRNLGRLASASGRTFSCVHVVGGGSQNELLNQFIADACDLPVIAGPHEATSAGNIMAQMMADGEVASLAEGRELISRSQSTKSFEPQDRPSWDDAYQRLLQREDVS